MKNYSIGILTVLAMGIWWFSSSVVWLGDDIDYQFRMKGAIWQSWGWIRTWGQFWESQYVHYMNVNGRFVAHALVQLFCGILGQQTFAVCNGLIYALFAICLARAGGVRWTKDWQGLLTAACLSVICFVTKMMPTCQIGYIWMMTLNLIWLHSFFREGRPSWHRTVLLALAGIIVGNGQECISIGVCAGLGIWWLTHFIDWRRSWMMLGYFIGTAFCCLSPATLSRVATVSVPWTDQLIYCIPTIAGALIYWGVRKYCRAWFPTRYFRDNYSVSPYAPDLVWISAGIMLIIFNAIVGVYSTRQLFGINLALVILTLRELPRHRLGATAMWLAVFFLLVSWFIMHGAIQEVKSQYDDIVALHAESKDGSVEYDRHRVVGAGMTLQSMKYYEDVLGQFDNDLHHSMMKQLKHSGRKKTLKLKPATVPPVDSVIEYHPHHFVLTTLIPDSGMPPRKVLVHGHYDFKHFIIKAAPRELEITKYSRIIKPYGVAVIIPEYPIFITDSIRLMN